MRLPSLPFSPKLRRSGVSLVALLAAAIATEASAETLADAAALAYQTNPALLA